MNHIERFFANIDLLNSNYKWRMTALIKTLVAEIYTMNQKIIDIEAFKAFTNSIVTHVKWNSPFRSYQKYQVAARLLSKEDNPNHALLKLINVFNELREQGMPNNAYTIICAQILMDIDPSDVSEKIDHTKKVYKKMREKHFFLTSHSDYPLATLLSLEHEDLESLISQMEYYYQTLSKNGFTKGNDLQFLSHILMMVNKTDSLDMIHNLLNIRNELLHHGIKVRLPHYAVLGLLASLELTEEDYQNLEAIISQMKHHPLLKHTKTYNFIFSSMLLLSEKLDNHELMETNLSTSIEAIIQAQNAAMIAVMASASAAVSASAVN